MLFFSSFTTMMVGEDFVVPLFLFVNFLVLLLLSYFMNVGDSLLYLFIKDIFTLSLESR